MLKINANTITFLSLVISEIPSLSIFLHRKKKVEEMVILYHIQSIQMAYKLFVA